MDYWNSQDNNFSSTIFSFTKQDCPSMTPQISDDSGQEIVLSVLLPEFKKNHHSKDAQIKSTEEPCSDLINELKHDDQVKPESLKKEDGQSNDAEATLQESSSETSQMEKLTRTLNGAKASSVEDMSGRERLKRHRVEMAGRVWIPDMWGQEELLKDWIDCSAFDASIRNSNLMSARAALAEEGRRANSARLRIENSC